MQFITFRTLFFCVVATNIKLLSFQIYFIIFFIKLNKTYYLLLLFILTKLIDTMCTVVLNIFYIFFLIIQYVVVRFLMDYFCLSQLSLAAGSYQYALDLTNISQLL